MPDRNVIFVIGLEKFNLQRLKSVSHAERFEFRRLLAFEDFQHAGPPDIDWLVARARGQIEPFRDRLAAIVGYWDFPVTLMLPLLRQEYGLHSCSLESVLKCEHKYWSRIEQSKVIPETPAFRAFDPYEANALDGIDMPFPFWIKPVKSYLSQLSYRIEDAADFHSVMPIIREKIQRFAKPFDWFLDRADLPPDVKKIRGNWCIAEEIIGGRQCTVEGFVHHGRAHSHGVIDTITYPDNPSLQRLQYPSMLPGHVRQRLVELSTRLMEQIALENSTFNIEYFWDEERDLIRLIEINPRMSQSHSHIFEKVDGASNHQVLLSLALDEDPYMPFREGEYDIAAKFMWRVFLDGVIEHAPDETDVERLHERFPDAAVKLEARRGERLSEMINQDPFSYLLADIFLAGRTEKELLKKYDECRKMLPYRVRFDRALPSYFREGRAAA